MHRFELPQPDWSMNIGETVREHGSMWQLGQQERANCSSALGVTSRTCRGAACLLRPSSPGLR